MEKPVVAHVLRNRPLYPVAEKPHVRRDFLSRNLVEPVPEPPLVKRVPLPLEEKPRRVGERLPLLVVHRCALVEAELAVYLRGVVEAAGDSRIDHDVARRVEQLREEREHPLEVAHSDDRRPVSRKRVVRVVPLGTLRVHPDSRAGDVVEDFREDELDELGRERRQLQRAVPLDD